MGALKSKKWHDQCLGAHENKLIDTVQAYAYVTVSSTISDTRAKIYGVIHPTVPGFWAPPLDVKHGFYQMDFDRAYFIEKIIIKWKLKPPRFEVMVKTPYGRWKVMLNEEPQDDIEMVLGPVEVLGIKVIIMDLDKKSPDARGLEPIYGISKIEVKRPG